MRNVFSDNLFEVKLLVKCKDYELAYKKFEMDYLGPLILQFQREHIRHFLYTYYAMMES
jgi:hypothetical protein